MFVAVAKKRAHNAIFVFEIIVSQITGKSSAAAEEETIIIL